MTDVKEAANRLVDINRRIGRWMETTKYCSWCREWGHGPDECEKRNY